MTYKTNDAKLKIQNFSLTEEDCMKKKERKELKPMPDWQREWYVLCTTCGVRIIVSALNATQAQKMAKPRHDSHHKSCGDLVFCTVDIHIDGIIGENWKPSH